MASIVQCHHPPSARLTREKAVGLTAKIKEIGRASSPFRTPAADLACTTIQFSKTGPLRANNQLIATDAVCQRPAPRIVKISTIAFRYFSRLFRFARIRKGCAKRKRRGGTGMRRLFAMALVGWGIYTLWNNGSNFEDQENYLAYGAIALALIMELVIERE